MDIPAYADVPQELINEDDDPFQDIRLYETCGMTVKEKFNVCKEAADNYKTSVAKDRASAIKNKYGDRDWLEPAKKEDSSDGGGSDSMNTGLIVGLIFLFLFLIGGAAG